MLEIEKHVPRSVHQISQLFYDTICLYETFHSTTMLSSSTTTFDGLKYVMRRIIIIIPSLETSSFIKFFCDCLSSIFFVHMHVTKVV